MTGGKTWSGGPVSGYISGTPAAVLDVSPGALSFSGRAPAAQTLDVANAVSGPLAFTASGDARVAVGDAGERQRAGPGDRRGRHRGLPAGTHTATVRVESAGAEESPRLVPVTLTLDAQPPVVSQSARGPVGAWGFDEARGTRARDASGAGNAGRISGAVRTRGRFGGGLSFDGRNDWVTVADDPSLDLSAGDDARGVGAAVEARRAQRARQGARPAALVRALRAARARTCSRAPSRRCAGRRCRYGAGRTSR